MAEQKLLSSKMAGEILGFTPSYIRQLCIKGVIKADKVAKDWLIPASAIKKIKRQRKAKGM